MVKVMLIKSLGSSPSTSCPPSLPRKFRPPQQHIIQGASQVIRDQNVPPGHLPCFEIVAVICWFTLLMRLILIPHIVVTYKY